MVNDHHLDRSLARFEPETELLADGGEYVRPARRGQIQVLSARHIRRKLRRPLELEIVEFIEASLVEHGLVKELRENPRKIRHGAVGCRKLAEASGLNGDIEILWTLI